MTIVRSGAQFVSVVAVAAAIFISQPGCSKTKKKCIDKQAYTSDLVQMVHLLVDAQKAGNSGGGGYANAVSQVQSAANLADSTANDLSAVPEVAGEWRVAAARLKSAASKLQENGDMEGAKRDIVEATTHFQAAVDQLGEGHFCVTGAQ